MQWIKRFLNLTCVILFATLTFSKPLTAQDRIVEQPVTLELAHRASSFPQYRDFYLDLDWDVRQNLFLTLFRYDVGSREVLPQLAESYSVSEDGLTYTIKLRSDVYWVRYDHGQVMPVRLVTAEDAASALYWRCRAVDASREVYRVIEGCDGNQRASGIQVVDENTIIITLQEPASYLPSALTEPRTAPIPAELADRARFYAPENIVTNGFFAVQSFKEETDPTFVLIHNPLLPEDMHGNGNIERVVIWLYEGEDFSDWAERNAESAQDGTIAFPLPIGTNKEEISQFYSGARVLDYSTSVRVAVFNPDKSPFDDVRVRRAFSAAIDLAPL